MAQGLTPALHLFFALQILGASLFVLLIIASIVCHIRLGHVRHATFYSFCVSWVLYGYSHALLVLGGKKPWDWSGGPPAEHRVLCTVQAALIGPSTVLAASAALALVVYLLCEILSAVLSLRTVQWWRNWRSLLPLLLVLPWLIWGGLFVPFLVFGLKHPSNVIISERHTYCVIRKTTLEGITPLFAASTSGATILVEGVIAWFTIKHRNIVSRSRKSMAIRAAFFAIGLVIAVGLGAAYSVARAPSILFDDILATFPVTAAVVFGTQTDLLLCLLPVKVERIEDRLRSISHRSTRRSTRGRRDEETGIGQTVIDTRVMMDADSDELEIKTWTGHS